MENHKNYSIEEFVLDPSFQAYVLETNSFDIVMWENYFMRYPGQMADSEKAADIILLLSKANKLKSTTKDEDYQRFMHAIDRQSSLRGSLQSISPARFYKFAKIAAAIVLLITISGISGIIISNYFTRNGVAGVYKTVVGKGQKSKVFLPDGTEVWLNSESTLTYSTDFGNTTRDVILIGEAYFKVHKDKKHQFIVHISDVELKVYGTEFNVKSYSDENTVETTLVTGSLSIQKISDKVSTVPLFLKPKQRAVVFKSDQLTTIKNIEPESTVDKKTAAQQQVAKIPDINPENVQLYVETDMERRIAWKDQKMIFSDETFETLALMLERWYDVKIIFESADVQKFRFRGIFKNETIEQALTAMRYTAPFDYRIEHRTIYIKSRDDKK